MSAVGLDVGGDAGGSAVDAWGGGGREVGEKLNMGG